MAEERQLEVEALKREFSHKEKTWQEEKGHMEAKMERRKQKLDALADGQNDLLQRLDAVQASFARVRQTLQTLMVTLKGELNLNEDLVKDLFSQDDSQITNGLGKLKSCIQERLEAARDEARTPVLKEKSFFEIELKKKSSTVSLIENEKNGLAATVREYEVKCQKLQSSIDALETENTKLKQQFKQQQALNRTNSEVKMIAELKHIEMENEIKALKSQLGEARAAVAAAGSEAQAAAAEPLARERARWKTDMARMKREYEEAVRDLGRQLSAEKGRGAAEEERAARRLQQARARAAELEAQLLRLQQEREDLVRQLAAEKDVAARQRALARQAEVRALDAESDRRRLSSLAASPRHSRATSPGATPTGGHRRSRAASRSLLSVDTSQALLGAGAFGPDTRSLQLRSAFGAGSPVVASSAEEEGAVDGDGGGGGRAGQGFEPPRQISSAINSMHTTSLASSRRGSQIV
uniref:Uncharacterized protein n=1 Tax=Heterosigma akashiwo TaxID=2829 RepID=A0A7S3UXH0_HETAK